MANRDRLNGEIARRIERQRKAAKTKITQDELALRAGVPSARTYARGVAGQYDWKVVEVVKAAEVLGVPAADLLFGRDV